MKKRTKALPALCALLASLILPGFYNALKVVTYPVNAEGVPGKVRAALITDLHSCAYGEGQRELLDAVDAQKPDLVLLGGDIFDDDLRDDNALTFLKSVSGKYPCAYVTGNHEYWSGEEKFRERMKALEDLGIPRLSGGKAGFEIKGTRLTVLGVDDPYAWKGRKGFTEYASGSFEEQLREAAALREEGAFTILLTHRPEKLDLYAAYGFDLVLAGHAHGGQIRVPGLINGLWAPDQGAFPALAGGRYERDGTVMIVSRGLARESTFIPRLYDRPDLVIVDIGGAETE